MFKFTIPTERAPQSPRSLAVSIAVHCLAILLLFAIRFAAVSRFPAAPEHFTLIAPVKETPIVRSRVQAPKPREFRPLSAVPVHIAIPAVVIPPPEIETPKPVVPELPHVAPPILAGIPLIKASGFTEDKPAASAPAVKQVVKAAGFESSETSATGPVRGALSALGSFESAHSAEGAPVRTAVARAGGFGDASALATGTAHRNVVSGAAFGDTTVDRGPIAARQIPVASRFTPVEILSKPRPEFTAEARAKNIEGEVLLEVQFKAIGDVRVLRVVRGIGHGLDENAVAAAQAIRFRPAARDGAAVDSTALVHIVFQLAN